MSCYFKENEGENGGALYAQRSHITISGSLFTGNKAQTCGGAIYVSNSSLVLKGTKVEDNPNDDFLRLKTNKVEFTDNNIIANYSAILTASTL